jgi:PPP family 3-phenylpropionic acid transporter
MLPEETGLDERKPRSPQVQTRASTVFYLSILALTLFLPIGLHLPYFPVWLAARGFSQSEIAAALALPMILRVAVTPAAATIADKQGIAATLAFCAVIAFLFYCSLGFLTGRALVFAGAVLVATVLGLMPSLSDALTLAGIRQAESTGLGHIAYGHIRVWTSMGVLSTMLLSGWIVALFPGERIIVALAGLTLLPAASALLAATKLRDLHASGHTKGGLTDNPAQLRLAIAFIGAAALIQSSHAQIYSFATLHWKAAGLAPALIGAAWATGVASESLLFLAAGRYFSAGKDPALFLIAGAAGAILRWISMSFDPGPILLLLLQAMHGLSFGATYFGSVLLLGSIARDTHRARMQGWLASASALSLALATFACGKLTTAYGEKAYLAMAGLAAAGLILALRARALKLRAPA